MPSIPAEPNRLIGGRYRLLGKIGEGGMGAVFKAVDQVIGRHVALALPRSAEVATTTTACPSSCPNEWT